MPVYVYRNLNTDEIFELEQRITEDALTHHPETGDPVKRVIQPVGIAFKGSGFYVNDSRPSSSVSKTASEAKSGGDSSGDAKSASSDSAKSETKKETKKEAKSAEKKPSGSAG